jgi:beta-glucosidase-like glycosyl hydrolase
LDYAQQAEKLATSDLLQGTLQVLARCYLDCDSLAQAEATYRRMDAGYDIHTAYIIQSNLAKIAVRRHETNEAEEAIDSAFEEAENFYFKALEQKDDYYQATLEQERENERLTYTSNLHRRTFVVVVAALVILLIAMALIWRYRMRMLRRQRAIERRMHEQETRLLEQEKRMLELKTANQLTQLHQAEEVVAFLKSYILQRSEVVQKLSKATASHINLDAKEWAEVERTLNAIDGDRFVHLRQTHPELKEEDVQLCILTRLQLSNRSIGNIYGLTISAVQHRKLKLKKDLFGETDPDVTLEQVINQLIQPQQA